MYNITAKSSVRLRMAVAQGAHVGIGLRGVCLPALLWLPVLKGSTSILGATILPHRAELWPILHILIFLIIIILFIFTDLFYYY